MIGDGVLAGGVSSPVRAGRAVGGDPFVQTRGAGAYAYDAAGRAYVDYVMAYGPLLLGHAHPVQVAAVAECAQRGLVFGSSTPDEEELAQRIAADLPSIERLRFTTTGSEAVMGAIRTARAFTGRDVVLKFAGNYHGHFDLALLDAGASAQTASAVRAGIPAAVTADLRVGRYNDLDGAEALVARDAGRLAAIVVEPIVANMGLVMPEPGFLEGLRRLADASGAVLIFDEIITWLRLGFGGAQARVGVRPDLTTLGKVLGGGLPVAAFGGRAEIMDVLAPNGPCFTGGTHAGNPLGIGVALRTLRWLHEHRSAYATMAERGQRLADGIRAVLEAHELPFAVVALESIVDFKFRPGAATRNYDDARRADAGLFATFYHGMRDRCVLLAPSQNEVMFLSTEHDDAAVAFTIEAVADTIGEMDRTGAFDALRGGRVAVAAGAVR